MAYYVQGTSLGLTSASLHSLLVMIPDPVRASSVIPSQQMRQSRAVTCPAKGHSQPWNPGGQADALLSPVSRHSVFWGCLPYNCRAGVVCKFTNELSFLETEAGGTSTHLVPLSEDGEVHTHSIFHASYNATSALKTVSKSCQEP